MYTKIVYLYIKLNAKRIKTMKVKSTTFGACFTMGKVHVANTNAVHSFAEGSYIPSFAWTELYTNLTFEKVRQFRSIVRPCGKIVLSKDYTERMWENDCAKGDLYRYVSPETNKVVIRNYGEAKSPHGDGGKWVYLQKEEMERVKRVVVHSPEFGLIDQTNGRYEHLGQHFQPC